MSNETDLEKADKYINDTLRLLETLRGAYDIDWTSSNTSLARDLRQREKDILSHLNSKKLRKKFKLTNEETMILKLRYGSVLDTVSTDIKNH